MLLKQTDTIALIMAAGKGKRVGGVLPKQYQTINNRSLLEQSISAFLSHPEIHYVRVIIGAGDEDLYNHVAKTLASPKLLPPVRGGTERSDSVREGLKSLESISPKNVLIHDGVRPFVTSDLISKVIKALCHYKGVIPGVRVVDTLKLAPQKVIKATLDREDVYCVQTPQGFDFLTILNAHRQGKTIPNLTDDARLLEELNIPVKIIDGEINNRKITTPEDLKGDTMLDVRVGHGIDVHGIGPGETVVILGVPIPTGFSLVGHSDADVGLHSVTDALLGAIGDGDIGQHFSPKDDRWKGVDSSIFLKDTARRVRERGGKISHIDVTILGEQPKISPYREQMISRLAEILDIDLARVSVKATTTEKLGFLGREEGLAAFATATVLL